MGQTDPVVTADNASAPQYPDIAVRATTDQGVSEAGGHVFVAKTPEAFVHDDDGNLLSDGRRAYTWDGENRLVSMTTHASVPPLAQRRLVFAYDHMSRRATKHEFTRDPATGPLAKANPVRFSSELLDTATIQEKEKGSA